MTCIRSVCRCHSLVPNGLSDRNLLLDNDSVFHVFWFINAAAVEQEFASSTDDYSEAATNQTNDIESVYSEDTSAPETNKLSLVREEVEPAGTAQVKGVVRDRGQLDNRLNEFVRTKMRPKEWTKI